MKSHLKRPTIPKTWPIKRRGTTFITKPNPGPHSFNLGVPLKLVIMDMLGIAKNSKEVKKVLYNNEVLVDEIRRKEPRFPIGVMDTINIQKTSQYFRIVLGKGKISLIPIDKKEVAFKPCKITGKTKTKIKGKTQLNLYDGKNILVDRDDYKTGDTVVISLPKQEIKEHIKLQKGCFIYLIGGKHIGDIGKIEDIISNKIAYKKESGETVETLKKYVFVIGKDKPIISLLKKD